MPNTNTKAAVITRPTGITFVWKSDPFTPDRKWRACSNCGTSLHYHNPTGKQILGWCSECRNNAVIETKEEGQQ